MAKVKLPEMVSVKSSQIKAIGHDSKTNTLFIQFNKGGFYSYTPVTSEAHKEMMSAESQGKYFHANIRSNTRIETTKIS